MSDFTHLHLHTEYSLLDGVNRIPALMEKVKNNGMSSVAMTDHGVMYGLVEFWKVAKDFGIKPIIGCEVYLAPRLRSDRKEIDGIKYYHLLLLAKNKVGFHNLVKIISIGQLEGMYYRPRVDKETLEKYSEGIICTSACMAGPLATHLLMKQDSKAQEWLEFFDKIYPNSFYLELQRNGFDGSDDINAIPADNKYDTETIRLIKEQMFVNERLRDWSDKYKLPLVATTDAHYLNDNDREVQKILFCVKDGIHLDDPKAREGYIGTYVKTPAEMDIAFADDPTPLINTKRIEEQVEEYDIRYDRVQPKYWNVQKGETSQEILTRQTFEGAKIRYGEITEELKKRIEYELSVIHEKGYDDYFLVVSDIMKWAASNGILTGVRGSVAGSVVAHCLEIAEIDPLKWELYFERFLNPERMSPPDIDLDIQDSRRDELIEYVKNTYGENSVAAIAAIGRFKTKAAIRDVARVMGIDLMIADKLSKMVNVVFGKVFTIDKQMDADPTFKKIIESDPELIKLSGYVRKIEGMARHMSVHACGHLVTPTDIVNYTPLQKESGGGSRVITQLEGPWMEELGLMKFDFLGLRTLTIISNAIKNIEESKGVNVDFYKIPSDDQKTFDLFSRGETMGVFQFESPPMRKYLQDLKPGSQEDLCFMVAAYRPGPMKFIPDYIKRKHKEQEVEYLTPMMEPIVGYTYGFAIYQEQVIRIAVDLAGYTMGQADVLRKAMGKKKMDVMEKEEKIFKKGIQDKGMSKDIAEKLWDYLLPFADYGFNKAHAAGYAVLAYKCAYLKAHYPLEFMAALMYSDLNDLDRIVIDIEESRRMGYKVLPPDVNMSQVHFTVEGKKVIRFGLGAIKNVGEKICDEIVKAREKDGNFANLDDLIIKVTTKKISKKALECLIKVGACDQFGSRDGLLAILPNVYDRISKKEASSSGGQQDIFSLLSTNQNEKQSFEITPVPELKVTSDLEKSHWEKDLIGMYLSNHPLKKLKKYYEYTEILTTTSAKKLPEGSNVKVGGIITHKRVIKTKNGNKEMAFVKIECIEGSAETVIFNKTYMKYVELLDQNKPLVFIGKTSNRNGDFSIIVDDLKEFKDFKETKTTKQKFLTLDISNEKKPDKIKILKEIIMKNPGKTELKIYYADERGNKVSRNVNLRIDLNDDVMEVIDEYIV